MAESRAERKARRALIEAAEGSEEKKSSKKSKSSQDAKGKSAKGKAKAKRPGSRRNEDKASQTRSKRSHKDQVSSARKAVDPKSPCSIMKACGGCTALNRPYKKQLAAKQAAMEELFATLCEREGISVDPIRGMGVTLGDPGKYPAPRGFRHKAATPFAPGKEGAVRCGFFERGTHKIVAVPSVLSRHRVPVRFSTASHAKLSGCIFPPLMRTSILVCFAMPSSAAVGVPTRSWSRS